MRRMMPTVGDLHPFSQGIEFSSESAIRARKPSQLPFRAVTHFRLLKGNLRIRIREGQC